MKQRMRHLLSVLLACVMVLSLLPISALADEPETPPTTVIEPVGDPAPEPEPEPDPAPAQTIYVSESGDDTSGDGTEQNPYATLAKAVGIAPAGQKVIIYVMSDLTMTNSARFWDVDGVPRDITITSDPESLTEGQTAFTISRTSGDFTPVGDQTRGGYNPGLFEIGNGSDLTLTHIILDDGHYGATSNDEGPYFNQVDASRAGNPDDEPQPGKTTILVNGKDVEVDNHGIVQDAMITSFDPNSTITLGEGAVLQNYGGMSAVRIANATLIMEDGSKILDTDYGTYNRTKGKGGTGPAGAVWIQSGNLIMNEGAEICDMNGRAVYADGKGSTATINGDIHDITGNKDMWNGQNGVAIHLRNYSDADLYGMISEVSGTRAIYIESHSNFNMHRNSVLRGTKNGGGIQLYGNNGGTLYMDGEITGFSDSAIHMNCDTQRDPDLKPQGDNVLKVTIGENGDIHHNTGGYGNVTMQTYNGILDIYGKIRDNYGGPAGIAMAGNHDKTTVTLYNKAQITGNVSDGTAGITVSKGTVIMKDGASVSDNISVNGIAGVSVSGGGEFIMEGGTIKNNFSGGKTSGIAYVSAPANPVSTSGNPLPPFESLAVLKGGTISGNKVGATITVPAPEEKTNADLYSAEGGEARDLTVATSTAGATINRYMTISDDAVIGNEDIYFAKYNFTLDNPGSGVKFGNASTDCETAVTAKFESQNLTEVVASLWYQSDKSSYLTTINGLKGVAGYNREKDLYAAVIETKEDGTPVENAKVTLQVVEWDENDACHLVLPSNTNGYAVVFVQEADVMQAQVVKITPADMTVYMGGDDGYEGVVGDESGTGTPSNSMPTPLFSVDVSGITGVNVENIVLSGDSGRQWNFKPAGNDLYYIESTGAEVEGKPQDPVRVTFTGIDGKFHLNDEFNPTELEELYATYAINIYRGGAGEVTASVNGTDCLVATGTGMLTVRAVADEDPTINIVNSAPTEPVKENSAVAVAPAGTNYTINNTGVAVDKNAAPALLFDHIIEDAGSSERTDALKAKVDETLGAVGGNATRHYEIMYLDLVDANNGNAWIQADKPVDIYWGYPKGTGINTTFQIVHFKDLHRDGTNSGYDVSDIEKCAVDTSIQVRTTTEGIKFSVSSGGFSPFALVWTEGGSSSGGGTGTRDDYTLHYVTNGGNHLSSETKSSAWTKDYEDLPIPVRDGYTFEGWYWDLRLTEPVTGDVKVDKTTVSLYAKWSGGKDYGPDDTGVSKWLETDEHNAFLSGYPDGSFLADKNMTRAEVAQMFYALLLDKDVTITKSFSDVPSYAWYAKAVNTLSSLGMLGGYPDGTFRPDAPITRAEFAAIALAFAYDSANASCSYTDVSANAWYYTYVAQATTYGWIGGYPDGSFRPNNSITRAEVAVIVNNMLGRDADESYIDRNENELVSFVDLSKNHWAYYTIMEATNSHDYTTSSNGESWKA